MILKVIKHKDKEKWFGRLGNNLRELRNAIQIALQMNISKIVFDHELTHKYLNIQDIVFHKHIDEQDIDEQVIELKTSELFYMFTKDISYKFNLPPNSFKELDHETSRQNCLKYLTSFIKIPNNFQELDWNNTLVVHIRSGDIDTKNRRKRTQPPLSFYTKLIKIVQPKTTIVVTEPSMKNPCIERLKKVPNIIIQSKHVIYDFYTMLQASYLAVSNDSWFAHEVLFFSKKPKTFYYTTSQLSKKKKSYSFTEHIPQKYYIKDYIDRYDWEYTEENIKKMIEHTEENVIAV